MFYGCLIQNLTTALMTQPQIPRRSLMLLQIFCCVFPRSHVLGFAEMKVISQGESAGELKRGCGDDISEAPVMIPSHPASERLMQAAEALTPET